LELADTPYQMDHRLKPSALADARFDERHLRFEGAETSPAIARWHPHPNAVDDDDVG
jgi:hypothetical protein